MSTNRRMASAWGPPRRDPEGHALCRWCGRPVPKGRRTFCSQSCVDEFCVRTDPSYARAAVKRRDHGVCHRCGRDTQEDLGLLHEAQRAYRDDQGPDERARAASLARTVWDRYRMAWDPCWWMEWHTPALWEAHHVVPVVEGGGECGLDGLVTLCVRCHREETAAMAARRAEERDPEGARARRERDRRRAERADRVAKMAQRLPGLEGEGSC